jgi:hypothetical protein
MNIYNVQIIMLSISITMDIMINFNLLYKKILPKMLTIDIEFNIA